MQFSCQNEWIYVFRWHWLWSIIAFYWFVTCLFHIPIGWYWHMMMTISRPVVLRIMMVAVVGDYNESSVCLFVFYYIFSLVDFVIWLWWLSEVQFSKCMVAADDDAGNLQPVFFEISCNIFLAFKLILMMRSDHIIRQLSYRFMCEIMTWSDDKTKLIHKNISTTMLLRALKP